MPSDFEHEDLNDEDLNDLFDAEVSDDEWRERLRQQPARLHLASDAVLGDPALPVVPNLEDDPADH